MKVEIWWSDKIQAPALKAFLPFVQSMAMRLLQGHCRYGGPDKRQKYWTRMKLEITAYNKTGNREHLLNIANYALLEAAFPEHKKFHHDATAVSATRERIL